MKCDYCENEAMYSFGIILENRSIDIFCCDDHIENTRIKQDRIKDSEAFRQRINVKTRKIKKINLLSKYGK